MAKKECFVCGKKLGLINWFKYKPNKEGYKEELRGKIICIDCNSKFMFEETENETLRELEILTHKKTDEKIIDYWYDINFSSHLGKGTKNYMILTNYRIIFKVLPNIQLRGILIHDSFCSTFELDCIKNLRKSGTDVNINLINFGRIIISNFGCETESEKAFTLIKQEKEKGNSLLSFHNSEDIIFKNSFSLRFLPKMTNIWSEGINNIIITNKRILVYKITHISDFKTGYMETKTTFTDPFIQYFEIPVDKVKSIEINKKGSIILKMDYLVFKHENQDNNKLITSNISSLYFDPEIKEKFPEKEDFNYRQRALELLNFYDWKIDIQDVYLCLGDVKDFILPSIHSVFPNLEINNLSMQ